MNNEHHRSSFLRFPKLWKVLPVLGLLACVNMAMPTAHRDGVARDQLNLPKSGLALEGYDPVAYFPEGGGEAKEGKRSLTVNLRSVTFRFASEANREVFLKNPEQFEPHYGGWCAWAMADGDKVEVDPKSFLIEAGRLLVFYDGIFADTRKSWLKQGGEKLTPTATANWNKFIGRKNLPDELHKERKVVLGLAGNDPLSIGKQTKPMAGSKKFTTVIGGVEYRFVNAENRVEFLTDPESHLSKQDS